ncbi:hypothetical protein ILYODFUR_003732 [Ilyodon furcidens]|uniref:Uncharacterized protein n=1 Tax=Ilyodon furcidens TaxID=33524 RepID=A0ABV0U5C5_9TELE
MSLDCGRKPEYPEDTCSPVLKSSLWSSVLCLLVDLSIPSHITHLPIHPSPLHSHLQNKEIKTISNLLHTLQLANLSPCGYNHFSPWTIFCPDNMPSWNPLLNLEET